MTEEKTSYRERTAWAGWVNAIYWGAIVLCCYPLLAGWDTDMEFATRLLVVGLILGFATAMKLLVGGLTVLVQETRIFMYLGSVPLIKKIVPYGHILALESVHYRPIMEFGGWGIRGWGKKKAWSARGDEAVVLTLPDDHLLYIGSDHPHRLEERIRTAAGEQLGAQG